MANAPNPSAGAAKAAQPQPQPQPSLSPYTIHQLYQSQSSNPSILYPVASSGRGFNPRPVLRGGGGGGGGVALSGSNNSNNNLAPSPSYAYRPVAAASAVSAVATTATIDSHMHPHLLPALHSMRQHPSHHYPPLLPSAPNPIKGFPVTAQPLHKVTPSPVSDSNGYKSARGRDDTLVVRNRKVRISDGATLYSLCRSWLRNGFPEETQPQHGDAVRSLPRPLPIPAVDNHSAKEEGEEDSEFNSKQTPPFLEVLCKSSGKTSRFAAGTKAEFAVSLINRKLENEGLLALNIEAVKDGEEPVSFGPGAVLVDYGNGWRLQTVTELDYGGLRKKEQIRPTLAQIPNAVSLNARYPTKTVVGPGSSFLYVAKILLAFVLIFVLGAIFTLALENLPGLILFMKSYM